MIPEKTYAGVMTTSAADTIRAAGLRVTAPRLAVYDVLAEDRTHADADRVFRAVRDKLGTVSVQTVYDVLGAFARARLVRVIDPAGFSSARYELNRNDNHHHLVCRTCGDIRDVACGTGSAPCLEPADDQGFVVDEAEVVYWGQCPQCGNRNSL